MIQHSNSSPANPQLPHRRRPALAALAVTAGLVAGGIVWGSLPASDDTTSVLPTSEEVGIEPNIGTVIPTGLSFRNEADEQIELAQLFTGKPVILAPVYYRCPMLCNMTMDGLVRGLRGMQREVPGDFSVITVSFNPREGAALAAAAKKTAMTRYGREDAAAGWHFLTGDEEPIRELTDAIGFRYKYDQQSGQYAHAAGLFVLTPQGKIARFLGGVDFAPRDLTMALSEAAEGRSTTVTEQILLLCFHYDPAKGKYGLAILRLMRFAGVLTVGLLVAGIVVMVRRDKLPPQRASDGERAREANRG